MGKSRAEIQRAYRERKNAELGDTYLRKESERVKQYYTKVEDLPTRQRSKRRENNRLNAFRYRQNRRRKLLNERRGITEVENKTGGHISDDEENAGPCDSTFSN